MELSTYSLETVPEEILCKLLENELSAITFDVDQTWSFATQVDNRFTILIPHRYQTNILYLKSMKGKSRIVPETYSYCFKVQSSYSDSCLDKTCKMYFWKKNWTRIWSEFQARIKNKSLCSTLNDQNLNPKMRKKQLLRRIKGLGLTMVPLKSRTKILNVEKESPRNVYFKVSIYFQLYFR